MPMTSDMDRALDLVSSLASLRDELQPPVSAQVEQLRRAAIALAASARERRLCRASSAAAADRGDVWGVMEMGQAERRLRERESQLIARMGLRLSAVIAFCDEGAEGRGGSHQEAAGRFLEAAGEAVQPLL